MYVPPLRNHYESILSTILGPAKEHKSSKLLQAYVTFSAMASCSDVPIESYRTVCRKYADYNYALLRITDQQCKRFRHEELVKFIDLSFQDFLTYVTPDVVCEPETLIEFCAEYEFDQVHLLHHIISIKLNSYQKIAAKNPSESITTSNKEDALDTIYHRYKENEKHPLPKSSFKAFYSAINLHKLNPAELSPRSIGTSAKTLSELLSILFDDLQLTRTQSIQMVRDFFCDNAQSTKISKSQQVYNFIEIKDKSIRKNLLNKALRLMAKISPLELLCAITMRKKDGTANERNKTEAYTLPNDVTLENSLVFSLFFSNIAPQSDSNILILLPSPQFVTKILWSNKYKKHHFTFVFDNQYISDVLNYQANDPSYAPAISENIHFVNYSQWIQVSDSHTQKYSHVLLFGTRLGLADRNGLISVLAAQCIDNCSLLVLDPSQYIENKNISILDNDSIVIRKIGLIPQGINNSTQPRRKVLLQCNIKPPGLDVVQAPIELHTYTLNSVLKTQALSPMHEEPVLINCADLYANPQTLRQQYSREIILRRPAGRERTPSFSHEITPDITVWCSKTYPKNNQAKPRLEAYVCEPAPASRINSGFTERGPRIQSTIKHTTSVPDEKVLEWLENEYPYSIVSPKRTNRSSAISMPTVTNIREEVIAHYTEYLRGQNIALKTLWYLYPSLSDHYSKSSYDILSSMMQTMIGEQRVCDLTAETCENLLISEYPNLSQNSLWARFEILSIALDQAVILGYCTTNILRTALRQAHVRDKLFAQVRNALTKKHFTRSEMQKAYAYVLTQVEQGRTTYLGVLFRLTTGLESKIVCALRWCDLLYSSEYNLYSAIIARKMNDDGSFEGFLDNEDYLTFPIPERLLSVLLKTKKIHGIKNDNQLILDSLLSSEGQTSHVSPRLLNQLTREMILSIGIDEKIVSLPQRGDQGRETDLNKYNGDIIRENFKFWATEAGKLNTDELSYLLRNKPASTLGCYYCDFLNEASQLILQTKLNRIDAALYPLPSATRKQPTCISFSYNFDSTVNQSARNMVLLELHANKETNVEVKVNSQYGVIYDIMKTVKEDV